MWAEAAARHLRTDWRTLTHVSAQSWPEPACPATRIWVDIYNISAVYTADGSTIQFDNGTIWLRYVPAPPPVRAKY